MLRFWYVREASDYGIATYNRIEGRHLGQLLREDKGLVGENLARQLKW